MTLPFMNRHNYYNCDFENYLSIAENCINLFNLIEKEIINQKDKMNLFFKL